MTVRPSKCPCSLPPTIEIAERHELLHLDAVEAHNDENSAALTPFAQALHPVTNADMRLSSVGGAAPGAFLSAVLR